MSKLDIAFIVVVSVLWLAAWGLNKIQKVVTEAQDAVRAVCNSLRAVSPGQALKWTVNGENGGDFVSLRYEDFELICDKAGYRIGPATSKSFEWKPKEAA